MTDQTTPVVTDTPVAPAVDTTAPVAPTVDTTAPVAPTVDTTAPVAPTVDTTAPVAPAVDTTAPAVDPTAVPGLTIQDLTLTQQIIQVATSRGAFKADELSVVGGVYDRITKFLDSVAAANAPSQAADATGTTEEAK